MIKFSDDPAILALYARLGDILSKAEGGELGVTPFLTPKEAIYARSYMDTYAAHGTAWLCGGYEGAERVRAVLLPAYVEGLLPADIPQDMPLVTALAEAGLCDLACEVSDLVAVLSVQGSGFCTLSHRDYLGSVLGLGLERDVLGDILVSDDDHAYLICKGDMVPFLLEHLTHVGHDPVKVVRLDPTTPIIYKKNVCPIHDTVASPRMDCVVAALCNLPREKAQMAVRSGLVTYNYETCDKCDLTVETPCVLSVRGVGKFSVTSIGGETRKGRLRMTAEKYL